MEGDIFEENEPNIIRGKDYFLGIGINQYQHFTSLENAVNDINSISDLLIKQFGFENKKTLHSILLDEKATRKNIIKQLKSLCRKVKPEDRVLIYYSGHGHLDDITDLGYWIPVDGEQDYDATFVSNSDIRDLIKAMNSRHTLLISDSCFSGSLLVRNARGGERNAFDRWEGSKSRWLFCSGKGVVSDKGSGENSPFTEQIIKHLSNPTYDRINISRLADDVIRSVSFNHRQQAEASPFFGADHNGGQYIFYREGAEGGSEIRTENAKNDKEEAKRAAADLAFKKVVKNRNQAELLKFLSTSNNSEHKEKVLELWNEIENEETWNNVDRESLKSLKKFVSKYANHPKVSEAKKIIKKIGNKTKKSKPKPKPNSGSFNKNYQKSLIANNKIDKVFKNIESFLSTQSDVDDLKNELTLLQSRYSGLLRDSRLGLLRANEESVTRNRITASLLAMLDDL